MYYTYIIHFFFMEKQMGKNYNLLTYQFMRMNHAAFPKGF